MDRVNKYSLNDNIQWDIIIIGGGATGLGIALDAATRGYKTLLLEQSDFAKGTSSRSTKLIHGGVRYLAQGNFSLVKHALFERGLLLQNAAHLVKPEKFIIPCYSWFEVVKYYLGLKFYDLLSGKYSFGKSKYVSENETIKLMPGIKTKRLKGAISYYDGKFDDARLAINIAQTATKYGATLLNYIKVNGFLKSGDAITGIKAIDTITKKIFDANGKVIINASGIFVDDILKMNNPLAKQMVSPSQGVHIVLKKHFLSSEDALLIPNTSDGRVLFAVPWHQHVLVGTTDTPIDRISLEPKALQQEIDFILKTAGLYFKNQPVKKDILSVFAGLRPLISTNKEQFTNTKEISRNHKLVISAKGLITITGGKWTTYRLMAEQTIDLAIKHANLNHKVCKTKTIKINGCENTKVENYLNIYGTGRFGIEKLMKDFPSKLHDDLPYTEAEVIWIIRNEMVENIEDILSRRLRILFIDAKLAKELAPIVAKIMAKEINANDAWIKNQVESFSALANNYLP